VTITLQDLQVLEEKADANWYMNGPAFTAALLDYYHSGALQRLAELAEDGERYRWLRNQDDRFYIRWTHFDGLQCDMYGADLDAAIDSARAPSVKEGKS
jgi:hypothetical protein